MLTLSSYPYHAMKFTKALRASQCGRKPARLGLSIPGEAKNSFRAKPRETPYQFLFVRSSPFFNLRLPFQGRRPISMMLLVNKGNRPSPLGKNGSLAGIMLFNSFLKVLGDTRIERAIGTAEHIYEPRTLCHFNFSPRPAFRVRLGQAENLGQL